MWLESQLAIRRKIRLRDFVDAIARHLESRPQLGRVALQTRMLSMRQVFDVLRHQEQRGCQFGQAAIELGYIEESGLALLLMKQHQLATPVEEILIAAGAISREEFDHEAKKIRAAAIGRDLKSDIDISQIADGRWDAVHRSSGESVETLLRR